MAASISSSLAVPANAHPPVAICQDKTFNWPWPVSGSPAAVEVDNMLVNANSSWRKMETHDNKVGVFTLPHFLTSLATLFGVGGLKEN